MKPLILIHFMYITHSYKKGGNVVDIINPFTPKSDFIDFTLATARRFYSSNPLGVKGLKNYLP